LSHGLASVGGRRRRAGSRSGGRRPYQRKPKLGVRLELVGVQGSTEFDAAFATIKKKRPDALIVEPDNIFYFHSKRIVDFATKSRLPAVFTHREFADAGGLVVYGANYSALFRLAAFYVDKILKGANPA